MPFINFRIRSTKMMRSIAKLVKGTTVASNSGNCQRLMSSAPVRKTVTLIPGDGIGPEIAVAVQK